MEPSTSDITALLQTINALRSEVMLFILALAGIAGIFLLIRHYLKVKKDREAKQQREDQAVLIERAKQSRAVLYTDALNGLTRAFSEHTTNEEHLLERLDATLDRVSGSVGRVDACLTTFLLCQTEAVNVVDSKRLIKEKFTGQVLHAIVYLIEKSLRENDFVRRQTFITSNMKTGIGQILVQARNELRDYKLAVHSDEYFLTLPDTQAERFILCENIWNAVEGLYKAPNPLDQRLQELRLTVQNVIADYVTEREHTVREKSPSTLLRAISPIQLQGL